MDSVHIQVRHARNQSQRPRRQHCQDCQRRPRPARHLPPWRPAARGAGPALAVLAVLAAYRHFANRDDLLAAVRAAAVAAAAHFMEAELAQVPTTGTRTEQAHAKVRAVGAGYMRFAHAETGLFRTAFGGRFTVQTHPDPAMGGATGLNPFQHLSAALDDLVTAGALPAERRPGAEYLAWSTVHGMALLSIDGPLRGTPQPLLDGLGQRLLDMVERGI